MLSLKRTYHAENGLHRDCTSPGEGTHSNGDGDNQPDRPNRCLGVAVELSEESTVRQASVSAVEVIMRIRSDA